jgi:hypothetical protein
MSTPSPIDPSSASTAGASSEGTAGGDRRGPETAAAAVGEPDTASLIAQLDQDRLWLLRQIDSGRWAEWRLDLAALERELGQLLEQARERGVS